ncbi:hypothetical protein FY557_05510 [Chryseobacterium sp. SN22]|uniref:hypothetical protein n=1 Tax=Chryseobacterium sp. SN22 TaxID=2606431 RepID=UPI0011EE647B|nr:hypothetical protein [Chryseobacterium sp. SN22]KAA0129356.1 hypothetical protein FY557_05510 [Chryseobacterium sp. SN22]
MNNQSNNQYRKLDEVSTQYRKFSKGQYIEHTQFNEFLDFFEDQDRLSRVMLQGVGIVCGLKPVLIYKNRLLSSMKLSQGAAVTTDGDLLTLNDAGKAGEDPYVSNLKTIDLQNKDYTHFKKYDNFKAQYPAFKKDDGSQIELWELISAQEAGSGDLPISDLPALDDKYLLLYLESYEKEVKPCRGVDCDNHGVQQIRNLKVLAATKSGIDHILKKDKIRPHALFIKDILEAEKQERVILERLLLEQGDETEFYSFHIKNLYSNALENSGYGASLFKKINAISQFMGLPAVDHEKFTSLLEQFLVQYTGFQYAYDLLKDLTDTYSEIIKVLPKSFTLSFPDLESFPKHVMLGKLGSDIRLDEYRHRFYNSPVLDDEKETLQVKVLLTRFAQQVQNFKYSELQKGGGIKITPSRKLNPLGRKAVPFYYQVTPEFLKVWNFNKTAHRSSCENLAYDISMLSSAAHIQNPVNFNTDKNTFYNIEGHQGMSRDEAYDQLKELRDRHQLGFDIMLLSFGELRGNKDLFKAYFNEYVEKHPGLEHKRGVERGGTFVMVYEHNGSDTSIIADFSIPYICCTPKIDAGLSLPASVICADAGPIPFTVLPVGGVVKAAVDSERNGVVLTGGKYFFDPKELDESLHGQSIAFTVNGKPTSCRIKVIAQPDIDVKVDYVFYPEGNSGATTVVMLVSGENFKDYSYSWDFLDNGSFVTLSPDNEGRLKYTLYNVNPARLPTIKVKVESSGCTQEVAIRDWYKESTQLSLPVAEICSDSKPVAFTVSPAGGIVEAGAGAGVQFENGKYTFNPARVDKSLHGHLITFTVNGQPTNCRIKVITKPEINVEVKTVDYPVNGSSSTTVHFLVSGTGFRNYSYSWDFLENGNFTAMQPDGSGNLSYTFNNLDRSKIPVIKVKISNGNCIQEITINNTWYNPPAAPSVVINSIGFPSGNCCEGTVENKVTAFVERDDVTIYLSSSELFELKGWASGAEKFDYSWFQTYSSTGYSLPIAASNTENLVIYQSLRPGIYEFQFMAIDINSGAFDTKKVKVSIYS